MIEVAPGRFNLIDGKHRVEKAKRKGVTSLSCYRVPPEVHTQFLINQAAYEWYVNYWNENVDSHLPSG